MAKKEAKVKTYSNTMTRVPPERPMDGGLCALCASGVEISGTPPPRNLICIYTYMHCTTWDRIRRQPPQSCKEGGGGGDPEPDGEKKTSLRTRPAYSASASVRLQPGTQFHRQIVESSRQGRMCRHHHQCRGNQDGRTDGCHVSCGVSAQHTPELYFLLSLLPGPRRDGRGTAG